MEIFQASLENLYEMLAYVRKESEKAAFHPSLISRIELALEEALVNIIHYAYPENREGGWVQIDCSLLATGGIQIEVRDQGVAYNPLDYIPEVNPSDGLDGKTLGGYGIFFIRNLMDEINYRRDGKDNVLTLIMRKKL